MVDANRTSRQCLQAFAALVFLVSAPGVASSLNLVGTDEILDTGSEYLFGFSGGPATTLSLDGGSFIASTGTRLFEAGANNQGWWTNYDFTTPTTNDNYIAGYIGTNPDHLFNNFFTFDISSLSGPVTSAVLDVGREEGRSSLGFQNHTYSIFDVSTQHATLNANSGRNDAIFADLGSGVHYGSFDISVSGLSSEVLHLSLNANAVADLNASIANHDNHFSIGGTLFPLQPVPEPATLWTLGLGLLGFHVVRRRRRHD